MHETSEAEDEAFLAMMLRKQSGQVESSFDSFDSFDFDTQRRQYPKILVAREGVRGSASKTASKRHYAGISSESGPLMSTAQCSPSPAVENCLPACKVRSDAFHQGSHESNSPVVQPHHPPDHSNLLA